MAYREGLGRGANVHDPTWSGRLATSVSGLRLGREAHLLPDA